MRDGGVVGGLAAEVGWVVSAWVGGREGGGGRRGDVLFDLVENGLSASVAHGGCWEWEACDVGSRSNGSFVDASVSFCCGQ